MLKEKDLSELELKKCHWDTDELPERQENDDASTSAAGKFRQPREFALHNNNWVQVKNIFPNDSVTSLNINNNPHY